MVLFRYWFSLEFHSHRGFSPVDQENHSSRLETVLNGFLSAANTDVTGLKPGVNENIIWVSQTEAAPFLHDP